MSARSTAPFPFRLDRAWTRSPRLRQILDAAIHLSGLAESRADRVSTPLSIHLGAPGATAIVVVDRRGGEPRTYRFETGAAGDLGPDDLAERLAAIAGGGRVRVKVLVDPAACFLRSLVLPGAALPRMRALLAEELEAATPFRSESVYSDWFVEGEDLAARALHVRHIVLKKARLDPLLAALARAGLPAGPVTVGSSEEQTLPIDLLSHGHRALPALLSGGRVGDRVLTLGAVLLLFAAFWGLRRHQEADLSALDAAFAAARREAGPPLPQPVQAGLSAIEAGRAPAPVPAWDALAAALPDSAAASALHLDHEGALVTLSAADEAGALAALVGIAGLGPPVLRSAADEPGGRRRLVVMLPRVAGGRR
ncbi:hypothetical protein MKK88_04570 [Methylobacterium sp. E-005]|uniref:hypothetical protein n=1 Tax=Methylobacterium sp. E-005 TaxID=2836549 RepID=UPI001FB93EBD|nr:hypothetical protein [Methylobacterium sp. E-005]MCJ2085270.1 hypothetical protein [Methylobacterium sp. E-005]